MLNDTQKALDILDKEIKDADKEHKKALKAGTKPPFLAYEKGVLDGLLRAYTCHFKGGENMPNDMVIERDSFRIIIRKDETKDGYMVSQTIRDNLLFSILQELKTISKKLDNLHRAYKP